MLLRIGTQPDHGFDEPLGLLSDCHRRIEHFLHVIAVRVREAAGGALTDRQRTDLEASLKYFATAAPRHTADEEESLFPRLRASGDPAAAEALASVARLEREHSEAERRHDAVDRLLRRWMAEGCLAAEAEAELITHVEALQATYRDHIAVEDCELFPAAARLLSAGQLADIGAEMAARRGLPGPRPPQP
jgi:hemerythrin-like domain-containing protein